MKKLIILFIICNLFVACTNAPKKSNPRQKATISSSPSKLAKHTLDRNKLISDAKAMIGVKYYFGGATPRSGFDCSGLIYYVFNKQGLTLPRTTSGQLRHLRRIRKSLLRPGDLVFFAINHRQVSHVGIYLGANNFIHSPSTGKKVNISSMKSNYWKSRFVSGGRL